MKHKITEESINSLQQEGLRFSVDTLAEKLKVSKKTIYKYFPTKEALAYAIYEKYYIDLNQKVNDISQRKESLMEEELLLCYFESARMVRKEIFNKFSLNDVIGTFARQHHQEIWNRISLFICGEMSEEEALAYKLIIDGAFDRAMDWDGSLTVMMTMLGRIR